MLKKILIAAAILLGIIILTGAWAVYYFKPDKEAVLNFIKNNPQRTAILFNRNDTTIAARNTDRIMPLGSTMKIIIAIEYARQAAQGLINADEQIDLDALDKFYIPRTDGDAHPAWLKSVGGKISDGKVSLREVTKGMIKFSSNANTEWLLSKLGRDRVNARIDSLGLKNHTPIYYIVSALFVGKEAFPGEKGDALKEKLRRLNQEEYIGYTNIIHDKLLSDTAYRKSLGNMSLNIQKVWSDKLPAATVTDYVSIMKKINSRTYFNARTHQYLDEVMEYILENPANREWLEHSGMKGGSTAFLLTKALYATDKQGNTTELAYFMNDLTVLEITRLQASMNEFELNILTNAAFREQVMEMLKE